MRHAVLCGFTVPVGARARVSAYVDDVSIFESCFSDTEVFEWYEVTSAKSQVPRLTTTTLLACS